MELLNGIKYETPYFERGTNVKHQHIPHAKRNAISEITSEIISENEMHKTLMMQDETAGIYEVHNITELDEFSGNFSLNNITVSSNVFENVNGSFVSNLADLVFVVLFCLLIIVTIIGNTLVILSVITTRRLRTVTNCFVMSLAVADWLVGIFVMPPAVAYYLMGSWHLGWILCDIWISLDVLLCTASILSLCAISIDRYLAVTQPLNYSRRRRSKRLAMLMILVVWILALAITCPPILGWYEPGRRDLLECRYNENKGYVVFSAMGSFFLPMLIMVYVYLRISCVVASRHDNMAQIKIHQKSSRTKDPENDFEFDSDTDNKTFQNRKRSSDQLSASTGVLNKVNSSIKPNQDLIKCIESSNSKQLTGLASKNGHYELVDMNKKSLNRNTTLACKIPVADCPQWTMLNDHRLSDSKSPTQTTSMTNINNNDDKANGNQLHSNNHLGIIRSRNPTKTLSTRISSLKRESKTTRTLSIVMFTFIASWLPFFINYLMVPFYPNLKNSTVQNILTWLGWINSAVNPFIYAFYSEDFRTAFYRLTLRRFCSSAKKTAYPYPVALSARR